MIKQGTSDTEILNLLFHDEKLSQVVTSAALEASVEYQNVDTL